nr:alpha-1,2-fucosyltransferase [Quadrisphaera sp. RL12-1S]
MVGNYTSEDYFFDVADVIRSDFKRVSTPDAYAVEANEAIRAKRAEGYSPVALHVRRGDYVQEAHTLAAHGVCSPEYYANAVLLVERLVENPWYFVFSNDAAWSAEHLGGERRTVMWPTPSTPPVEDMFLMAECDHHIIANSTYSWWAAWLGEKPGQVVVGPRPFMADRSMNTEDTLRRNWISLGIQPRPDQDVRSLWPS